MNHQATIVDADDFAQSQSRKNWAIGILVGAVVVMTYGFVQTQDAAVRARAELEQRKAVGCPSEIRGRPFVFSAYEHISMDRPGSARLSCWYKAVKP